MAINNTWYKTFYTKIKLRNKLPINVILYVTQCDKISGSINGDKMVVDSGLFL